MSFPVTGILYVNMSDSASIFVSLVSFSAVKIVSLTLCRRQKLTKFEKVGTVKSIYQYPLKSGGAIHLDSAICTSVGLCNNNITDRTWMVIRKDASFLSARLEPKLVLIRPTSKGDSLCLDAPGMLSLVLPKFPVINARSKFIKCRVWDEYITGLHCGEEADRWMRQYLGNEWASIVMSTESMEKRESCAVYKPSGNPAKEGDISSYADWGAYMILSEQSLEELNTRLEKKVTMTRFRPNISITGCVPYDEDNWAEMKIGDTVFMRLLDSCARCVLTTVDPSTGEKDLERQPLETLKSYRFSESFGAPCFGVNAAIDIEGEIKVGDPVYVLRKQ